MLRLLPLAACLLLFGLTRLHYAYWPLAWPDEALFSSPAAELAARGVFATPVLDGLLPGMERATLWNSPLYMVLLSGVYLFTGESQVIARGLALVCGFVALFLFYTIARRLFTTIAEQATRQRSLLIAGLATLLLALDPTFHRAANTARMDMLTLCFLLGSLWFLIDTFAPNGTRKSSARPLDPRFLLAGICAGLAGLSHPAGILAVPVILIFAFPRWRDAVAGGLGAALGIAPWLFYIVPNLELFQVQFLSQLVRKGGMLEAAAGGDTGGVLVVYFSQYGGTRLMMIFALLILTATIGAVTLRLLNTLMQKTGDEPTSLTTRIYLAFATTTVLVILASEAWYALYVGPYWLLAAGLLIVTRPAPAHPYLGRLLPLTRLGTLLTVVFFLVAPAYFSIRHRIQLDTPTQVQRFETRLVNVAATCSSIYLRVRPDPYFRLREAYPNMEVLEFVPGKLQIGGRQDFFQTRYNVPNFPAYLERRFDTIDCFLLDDHGDWEPLLTAYLDRNRAAFSGLRIAAEKPLEPVTLWRRR